jgi:hypothetical protein
MDEQDANSFLCKSEILAPQWIFKLNTASSTAETWNLIGHTLTVSHIANEKNWSLYGTVAGQVVYFIMYSYICHSIEMGLQIS